MQIVMNLVLLVLIVRSSFSLSFWRQLSAEVVLLIRDCMFLGLSEKENWMSSA